MSLWLVPVVGVSGFLLYRSWQHDAALRSGELMDVRDLLPDGEADIELRALAGRRYRVELQFEASLEGPQQEEARSSSGPAGRSDVLPYRLRVERVDGPILYERERPLQDLFEMGSASVETDANGGRGGHGARHWGCLPLLDFQSSTLGRLRFELSIPTDQRGARLEKAQLVVKEDVRRLRYGRRLLDRIEIDAEGEFPGA